LLTFAHPAEAHSGVRLDLGLILQKGCLVLSQHLKDLLESFSLFLAFVGDPWRVGPDETSSIESSGGAQGAANRLSGLLRGLALEKVAKPQQSNSSASATKRALWASALPPERLDPLLRQVAQKRSWSSPLVIVKGALLPFPHETMGDRVDGGTGAEKHPGDMGRAVAIRSEQHYVHAFSACG
jgi:hypothetical protein